MLADASRFADAVDAAALSAFNSAEPSTRSATADVRAVVSEIAATGRVRHDWQQVRPVLLHLLREAFTLFPSPETAAAASQPDVAYFEHALLGFSARPPFTVQRLCELLLAPTAQYTKVGKFAHALDKLLSVTSTVEAGPEAARRQEAHVARAGAVAAEATLRRAAMVGGPSGPSLCAEEGGIAGIGGGGVESAPGEESLLHHPPPGSASAFSPPP